MTRFDAEDRDAAMAEMRARVAAAAPERTHGR
jgi:hypothetical protein